MKKGLIWSNDAKALTGEELVITEQIEGAKRIDLDIDTDTERERTVESANWYVSELELDRIEADYYVLDFGVIETLRKLDIYLNGKLCVQSWCARSELRVTVPKTMLKDKNSILAVVTEDEKINMWPPGEGFVAYVPEDFVSEEKSLPAEILVEPCETAEILNAEKTGDGLLLSLSTGSNALFSMYEGGVFRITYPYPQKNPMEEICGIPKTNIIKPSDSYVINETADIICISGEINAVINKKSFGISVTENKTEMLNCRVLFAGDTAAVINSLETDEHIFGLGEDGINGIDRRGTMEDIWVIHDFEKCDLAVPFYISTKGYGFYMNSSYHSLFDIGMHDESNALITNYNGSADIFYISGGKPENVLNKYTALIGRPYMPTKWAFGFWQAGVCVMKEADARKTIENYKKYDIPLDVICVDPPWQKETRIPLEWNDKNWPDQKGFSKLLKDNNMELILWTAPLANNNLTDFDKICDAGLFAGAERPEKYYPVNWWRGYKAGLWDFTNPDTGEWFDNRIGSLIDTGADGFKIDGGDNSEVPVDITFHNGTNGRNAHNLAPHYFADCFKKAMEKKKPGKRVITWQRSAYITAGQFSCKWGGDQWADFSGTRTLIKAGQGAGICGVPYWAQDVGGFCANEKTSEELFVRSYQWGCMAPLSRAHGPKVEPWAWSERAREIAADCIRLRYRRMPYIYSLAHLAHETGRPIMYPLFFDHTEDKDTYGCDYQYKFGRYLMAAPIFEEGGNADMSADRTIYLPKDSTWYDFKTLKRYDGGQTITYHAEYDTMPVFIAEGAILPYGQIKNMSEYNITKLSIDVFPCEKKSSFTLYDDDGESLEYKDGVYDKIVLNAERKDDKIILSLNTEKVRQDFEAEYEMRIFSENSPSAVKVNGNEIKWQKDGKFIVFSILYQTGSEMNIQIDC